MGEEKRRLVRVVIVDPDGRVCAEKALLYDSGEQFTELDDQELYFEVGIKGILEAHNLVRATVLDEEASERAGKDIYLKPLRIRDLEMVVVTLAEFRVA
jgi:hypothetical protein